MEIRKTHLNEECHVIELYMAAKYIHMYIKVNTKYL